MASLSLSLSIVVESPVRLIAARVWTPRPVYSLPNADVPVLKRAWLAVGAGVGVGALAAEGAKDGASDGTWDGASDTVGDGDGFEPGAAAGAEPEI